MLNDVIRTDGPLPWFDRTFPYYKGDDFMVMRQEAIGVPYSKHEPGRRFYLSSASAGWWVQVQEIVDMVLFEEQVAAGKTPTLDRIPVIVVPPHESTHFHLYDFFLREDVPWGDFGLERVSNGWHTLVVDAPDDFERWVRKGLSKDYISHMYGAKSREVEYTITTLPHEILRAHYTLLPGFINKWVEYTARREPPHPTLVEFGEVPGSVMWFKQETIATSRGWLVNNTFPRLPYGEACAVIARHIATGEIIGLATMTITPLPQWRGEGHTHEAHIEHVMHSMNPAMRKFSVVPVMFLHLMQTAWAREGCRTVDLMANFDASVDRYKGTFNARQVPVPGLRWAT